MLEVRSCSGSGRRKSLTQCVCGGLLAISVTVFLTVFQRFSATDYPVIFEKDLLDNLVSAFDSSGDSSRGGQPELLKKSGGEFSKNATNFCQINLTELKDYQVHLDAKIPQQAIRGLTAGGTWQPSQCQSKYQVAIIIPYRDRPDHLRRFLQIMHPFLQSQLLDYKVVVVEQAPGKQFNRAKLFNVGFLETKAVYGHTNCLIFHDVDLIPLDARNIYACAEEPRHLSSNLDQFRFNLPYVDLFGGAVAMSTELFEEANGFSNLYFGWGGEDDDFRQNRIPNRPIIRLEPHIARYTSLRHKKATPNADRFKQLHKTGRNPEEDKQPEPVAPEADGLSNVQYKLLEMQQKQLYTHFIVEI